MFGVVELSESIESVPAFRYNYQLELGRVSLAGRQGTLLSEALRAPHPTLPVTGAAQLSDEVSLPPSALVFFITEPSQAVNCLVSSKHR